MSRRSGPRHRRGLLHVWNPGAAAPFWPGHKPPMSARMPAILFLVLLMTLMLPEVARAAELSADAVESAERFGPAGEKAIDPAMIRLQVLLDRSRFSPGVIDGLEGDNVSKAIRA